jgi:DNA-directed RNA polymerase specialized sigma24 family protein
MDDNFVEMLSRLDQIFKLLAVAVTKDMKQRDRIALFDTVGLSPKQIAELLGTSSNTVRVELVGIRKHKTKRTKR